MRKIRELMRLKYELGRSHREIAASLGVANSTVSDYAGRARAAGLSWPLPERLDDAALEAALFPPLPPSRVPRPEPDWDRVHPELQRHKGVTLKLLWLEYRTEHPDGYGYSRFCDRYRLWRGRLDVVLRQVYRAGEKAFVDYAGPKFAVVDGRTGEERDAVVFVGVLAASNELTLACGDGSYPKVVQRLARTWLLILDDWGLASLSGLRRHDLLEVLDDRYARRSTLLASQVPVEHWHDVVGDAILDRLLNNAHRIALKGASMRRLYDSAKTGTSR